MLAAGLFTQHYPLLQHLLPRLGLDRDLGVCGGQTYTLVDPGSGRELDVNSFDAFAHPLPCSAFAADEPRGAQLEFGSLRSLLRLPLRGLSFLSKIRFLVSVDSLVGLLEPVLIGLLCNLQIVAAQQAVRRPAFDLVDPIVMAQFDQPKV